MIIGIFELWRCTIVRQCTHSEIKIKPCCENNRRPQQDCNKSLDANTDLPTTWSLASTCWRLEREKDPLSLSASGCVWFRKADDCCWGKRMVPAVAGHSKSFEHSSSCRPCQGSPPSCEESGRCVWIADKRSRQSLGIAVQAMCEEGQQGPPLRMPLDEKLVAHSHKISTVSGKCQDQLKQQNKGLAKRIRRHEILQLA